jgi:PD-(D/E)XK nuclease family transposase
VSVEARTGIYDVLCEDEHKRVFIIEMQVDNYENLLERLQFYAFQVFTTMANKGKNGFNDMGVVHCICILKGAITENTNYHQIITLKNEDNETVMDNLVFHLIELGKFSIARNDVSKIKTEKEQLFYTMKYAHQFDPIKNPLPDFWEKDFFKVALQRLDTSKMAPMEVAAYENALLRVRTVAEHTDKKIKKAEEEGEARGEAQAIEKSIKRGLQMGILTNQQLADQHEVPVEFILKTQKSLIQPEKKVRKTRAKKHIQP